ncbi:MAG TPA: ABC-2 family transporter protein, partial [Clostridia bacterium]|nr:ABC-2 family transporter protein [Clostridia bacterium]
MKRLMLVYIISLRNNIASRMAYRMDFLFTMLMAVLADTIIPFITFLIYNAGASFPGWNMYEVLLIQGIFTLSRGLAGILFFGIVSNTLNAVREGTYDLFLIKPVPVLFLSTAAGFNLDSLGSLLSGVVLIIISLSNLPAPSLSNWLSFAFLIILSLIVLLSFAVIMAATVFKWVGNGRVYEMFDSISSFGMYPSSIYSKAFQIILTYILPVGVIGFLPASALLGKPSGS